MEYGDNGDLLAIIKRNQKRYVNLEETKIWSILSQILEGLNY